eukprot:s968_g10.t1
MHFLFLIFFKFPFCDLSFARHLACPQLACHPSNRSTGTNPVVVAKRQLQGTKLPGADLAYGQPLAAGLHPSRRQRRTALNPFNPFALCPLNVEIVSHFQPEEELQDDEETKELIKQILQRIEGIRGKAEDICLCQGDYNGQLQLQVAEIENSKIGLLEEQPVRVNGIVTVAYEPESTTEDVPLFEAIASATQSQKSQPDMQNQRLGCACAAPAQIS